MECHGLRPLAGGFQNHVYAWDDPDHGPICIKLYAKGNHRRRVDREWAALTLLAEHGVRGVPRPLWLNSNENVPAIGMTLLNGTPLLDSADHQAALRGLAHTTRRLQQVPLSGLLADLERVDSVPRYMKRLTGSWPALLADDEDGPLTPAMRALLTAWHDSGDAELLSQTTAPGVFSRGDSNLLNWLRDGDTSPCVDFEYSGHSTKVFDAADLIEHISAREIPDSTWIVLLPDLGVTPGDRHLFLAAQRTCALRWLAVLWKQRRIRTAEFDAQHARVRLLQRHDNLEQRPRRWPGHRPPPRPPGGGERRFMLVAKQALNPPRAFTK
ncbi:aminoglycoside phosphotransferase family protein [Actinomadura harenae]|uniref:Aminoglycoside phosphotransferase family protein n=1 Tax=Actinomadura harenae TaxID=2483351 RepID=A0A3M2M137_9ACTN|nr:aminoglycoside phosphotransferase family protein [Actinomadura harenae]RMI43337.1 aminoglycoside phosphotransferase family protein [Actinomadura harenae]